ncbi:hypothetical protein SODALDRAFT_41697 [Sodiomyces alkalinus F11]|uniref:Myb-like domain-containing protein n=1 Tax=Sodiomyces alkalinus (strain CBS 110278 / VKM F-3762 / F11) TaxID=1314773 RepID=A0A3N2Q9W4_SODAK|nr:hypothetical protein SODALDRAFT_41697 [Sodiomyces alkalinus F11]ROT43541.1 hypothetical protein SODALDRAFT_41697 [Sodiomyces alkalinus F11]
MNSSNPKRTPDRADNRAWISQETEYSGGCGGIDVFVNQTLTSPSPTRSQKVDGSPIREWPWTHELPTSADRARNGRRLGRTLIQWNRPRMPEKLLLCIQYECSIRGISFSWDAIAHRLQPGSSESAITQHLNRLRPTLLAEGHLIPPAPSRPGSVSAEDLIYRGFIRDDDNGDQEDARGVRYRKARFTEAIEHRKTSLSAVSVNASGVLPIKAFADEVGANTDEDMIFQQPKEKRQK